EEVGAEKTAEAGNGAELPEGLGDARERLAGEPAAPERTAPDVGYEGEARQREHEEEDGGRRKGNRLSPVVGDRRHAVEADDGAAVAEPDSERRRAPARR